MNRIRLKTGAAAIAIAMAFPATTAIAQSGATSAASPEPTAAAPSAKKKTAAERRKERRQQRAAAARATAPAASQTAAAGDDDIVVTGTRIVSNYGKTGSPVQTIERDELQRRGLAQLEDALNSLPAVQPNLGNQTRNTNNDAASFGRSAINLRNLGAGRTLVLVNGQRAKNDTNNIPAAMIERVEVLTGGASAVYGSDAVGGVINYILKRNFTGITIDGEGSFFQHSNDNAEMRQYLSDQRYKLPPRNFIGGPQGYINAAGGVNLFGGRANLSGNLGYRAVSDLASNKFDTTACPLTDSQSDAAPPNSFNDHSQRFCSAQQSKNPFNKYGVQGNQELGVDGGTYSNAYDGSKRFRQYNDDDKILSQPDDYVYRRNQRLDWGLNGRFRVDEASNTDIVATFSNARFSTTSLMHFMSDVGAGNISINCDNPFLSAGQAKIICGTKAGDPNTFNNLEAQYSPPDAQQRFGYRFVESRATLQARGKLTNDIRYEANIIRFDHRDHSNFATLPSDRRLRNALRARTINGQVVCLPPQFDAASPNAAQYERNKQDDAACQPADIFSTAGPSSAAREYLTQNPGVDNRRSLETIVNGTVSGTLGAYGIHSPFARDPIGFSVNVESRRQEYSQVGAGSLYTPFLSTLFRETDLSGELAIPLVQDKPLIKYLQVSGAYRRMFFPGQKGGDTYRLGASYRVDDTFSFRGSYSTSYRVDVFSTFSPPTIDFDVNPRLLDLCSPPGGQKPVVQRLTAAQCQRFGVTAQQYAALSNRKDCNDEGKCPGNILTGGNRNLRPEQGRS
ncbi:TonB-dependent receptor domain-containing protein [Sphingomonas sp. 8AM]|uniref:TonB-dependent receptor domain-containing protein n=1 Tax=Sphingomonas sp. 8AM TaxID=2653170 RepID=UPI0012EF9BDD|nr:TonB-dependent receptor [Sphingomonas sp. 8AM]VXC93736.1 conserved exported hypothetical protein [Sphingomonas sp. 8AM]